MKFAVSKFVEYSAPAIFDEGTAILGCPIAVLSAGTFYPNVN
jgi:hypothetical protein